MTAFRINLIREIAPPPVRRMRIFLLVVAYVAVFGVLSALVAWRLTARIVELQGRRQAMAIQAKWFRHKYPDVASFEEYADDVRLGLEHCEAQLTGIGEVIGRRIDLPPVLLAILQPMTPGMRMGSFSIDREKKSFGFEVSVPAATFERRRTGDADIMTAWNEDPVLRTRLKSIVLIGSRRARGPTGFEYVLTFSGAMKDGRTTAEP
jgi:hypothetical protein